MRVGGCACECSRENVDMTGVQIELRICWTLVVNHDGTPDNVFTMFF